MIVSWGLNGERVTRESIWGIFNLVSMIGRRCIVVPPTKAYVGRCRCVGEKHDHTCDIVRWPSETVLRVTSRIHIGFVCTASRILSKAAQGYAS